MGKQQREAKLEKQLAKKEDKQSAYDEVKLQLPNNTDFNIADLIQTLEDNGDQIDNIKTQFQRVNKRAKILSEPETKAEQAKRERQVAAVVMKRDIRKWLPVVKKNRESNQIDFTKQRNVQVQKISDVSNVLSNNIIGQKLEQAMEIAQVAKIDQVQTQQELQQNLNEKAKQRNVSFYTDIKLKRIAKIKSKIYRKIKKRQNHTEKLKLMSQLAPGERRKEIENMKIERAKERVTLRHSTKNKFTQQLFRFGGDKKTLKQQQSLINNLKQQMLKKANVENEDDLDYDDDEFKEQAILELERELKEIENQEKADDGQNFGFLKRQKETDLAQSKSMIHNLLDMVKNGRDIPENEQIEIEDEDSEQRYNGMKRTEPEVIVEEDFAGRAKFEKPQNQSGKVVQQQKPKKNVDAKAVLSKYTGEEEKVKSVAMAAPILDEKQQLIKGLNIKNLKKKYERNTEGQLTKDDVRQLKQSDDDVVKMNLANFNLTMDDDENEKQFLDEKLRDYEEDIPQELPQLKGWGTWAGFGMKERKPQSAEQLLQKKIKKIQEVQKKRKDQKLDNVIISEKRNNQFSKYLIAKLPHEYQNPEQFDQMHSLPIGPEWNSLTTHAALIQPKTVTQAGIIINPIKVPNKIHKLLTN